MENYTVGPTIPLVKARCGHCISPVEMFATRIKWNKAINSQELQKGMIKQSRTDQKSSS